MADSALCKAAEMINRHNQSTQPWRVDVSEVVVVAAAAAAAAEDEDEDEEEDGIKEATTLEVVDINIHAK